MNHTLLLNANAQPLSYLPISTISWQDAVKCLYVGAAEVLHYYDDWEVRSPSTTMQVPAVMILKDQIRKVRTWVASDNPGPQKHLVFLRDMYVCQYCNERFGRRQLTLDHVIPKYHGGRTRWDNVTTACTVCNCRRGHDVDIQPKIQPFRPTYSQLLKNMRKFPITVPHPCWNWYLGWDEVNVRLINLRRDKFRNDHVKFGIRVDLADFQTSHVDNMVGGNPI